MKIDMALQSSVHSLERERERESSAPWCTLDTSWRGFEVSTSMWKFTPKCAMNAIVGLASLQ